VNRSSLDGGVRVSLVLCEGIVLLLTGGMGFAGSSTGKSVVLSIATFEEVCDGVVGKSGKFCCVPSG